jgi:C terminal of Calcineurin-like phosphoesterase/N terminal of Calcineurin-like phosphoesterase/Calcineurin-like phosphoesterase
MQSIIVERSVWACLALLGSVSSAMADPAPSSVQAPAEAALTDTAGRPIVEGLIFQGIAFDDRNGDGLRSRREPGLAGVAVSDGLRMVRTAIDGRYRLPTEPGRTVFAIKPAGWRFAERRDGLPAFWAHVPAPVALRPKYGGIVETASSQPFDIALRREAPRPGGLETLVFGDPQVKSEADVGYYARDIIDSVLADRSALRNAAPQPTLGLSLGDIADDVLSLYPALNAETRRLGLPWLHAPGNHDIDFDVSRDEDSLLSFRNVFGPDTFAWEEPEALFVVLDDVMYRPGQKPAYIGGFREDQFAFLDAYLPSAPKDRLLVLAMHIPLFEPEGRDTFRDADRERLFALLQTFPKVLILSAHNHTQQHYFHDARSGWRGAAPLHEYNVGAACGAYWSGVKDARGVPDTTMPDGTPNGYARLHVETGGGYALSWHIAGVDDPIAALADGRHSIGLHAPKALRRGAYAGWGVYANVYMGREDTRVEFRIDDGDWKPMARVLRADPRLLIENVRDDLAVTLRGYDRSPEPEMSKHLWRGALPTDLALGAHRIEVRAFDAWQGEQRARTEYRLLDAEK